MSLLADRALSLTSRLLDTGSFRVFRLIWRKKPIAPW
jgi:hypothetical protein